MRKCRNGCGNAPIVAVSLSVPSGCFFEGSSRLDKGPHNPSPTKAMGSQLGSEGFGSLKILHGLVQLSTALRSRGGTDVLSCLRPRQSSRS